VIGVLTHLRANNIISSIFTPPIDLLSSASFATGQPHDQFRWLRENHPVYWHEEPDGPGFWAVTSYEGVHAVARDNALFSSEPTIMIRDTAGDGPLQPSMINQDDPDHAAVRKLMADRFTPKAARELQPRLERVASDIVDEMFDLGRCDLVADVAGKMASYVGAELLGIPREDSVALYRHVEMIHGVSDHQSRQAVTEAQRALAVYGDVVWQQKRARPADDLLSGLAHGEINGRPIEESEFLANFGLLMSGSSDTTRNLIAGGMLTLLEHPDQLVALKADLDALLPGAVEEMLRWLSPVVHVRRTTTRDTVLCGQQIRKGDKVVIWYGAANRDPRKFEDPERFDITRRPNEHIAFGFGGHFCLGVHIGRLEGRAMFRQLLTRVTDLQLAGPVIWLDSTLVAGPMAAPISYSPRATVGV
jgi:cytochrome P450